MVIGIGTAIPLFLLYWILYVVISVLGGDMTTSSRNSARYSYPANDLGWGAAVRVMGGTIGGSLAILVAIWIGADISTRNIFPNLFYDALGFIGDCLLLLSVIFPLELMYKNLTGRGFKETLVYTLLILTVGFASSIGISFAVGNLSSALLLALVGTGLPLAFLSLGPTIRQNRLLAKYRKSKERLIEP
ncbi:MAG: hypothetical protein HC866_08460 [Leptolyngbyaceae cyanobacterium RU_5_1]|nr:hypothetical protein [Leptolyngbyaceae cyanobacterium RU_5_1]